MPADAASAAIPPPIVPAPTTPSFRILIRTSLPRFDATPLFCGVAKRFPRLWKEIALLGRGTEKTTTSAKFFDSFALGIAVVFGLPRELALSL
jgi:hypothetical protein